MKITLIYEGGPRDGEREYRPGELVPQSELILNGPAAGRVYINDGTISHTKDELVVRMKFAT